MHTSIAAMLTPAAPEQTRKAPETRPEKSERFEDVVARSGDRDAKPNDVKPDNAGDQKNEAKVRAAEGENEVDDEGDLVGAEPALVADEEAKTTADRKKPHVDDTPELVGDRELPMPDAAVHEVARELSKGKSAAPHPNLAVVHDTVDHQRINEKSPKTQEITFKGGAVRQSDLQITRIDNGGVEVAKLPQAEPVKPEASVLTKTPTEPRVKPTGATEVVGEPEIVEDRVQAKIAIKEAATNSDSVYKPGVAQIVRNVLKGQVQQEQVTSVSVSRETSTLVKQPEQITSIPTTTQTPANPPAIQPVTVIQQVHVAAAAKEDKNFLPIVEPGALEASLGQGDSTDRPTNTLRANPAGAVFRSETPAAISQQIAKAIQRSPERTIELTLSPAELGRVRVSLSAAETGMVVNVLAERPETLELMRRNIESLNNALQEIGYQDVSFEFSRGDDGQTHDSNSEQFDKGSAKSAIQFDTLTDQPSVDEVKRLNMSPIGGIDMRL